MQNYSGIRLLTVISDFFFRERAAVHRLKLIQRPINFDSTCFNTVEKGRKRFQVNITIQQNRTDIEANAEAICQASLIASINLLLLGCQTQSESLFHFVSIFVFYYFFFPCREKSCLSFPH